ncbi:MAG: murein biosynthesis integral membrane protein MurJ [Candidatus Levybacteria bacterium]|nr:murein biosynthesis integral membrane protein MurJ [Candidatus Levybacteria bacterium]
MTDIFKKGITVLLKRQNNILSAAYIIMATVIFSQLLGLFRNRLLVSIFGASSTLGVYNYSSILPDTIFQLVIAAAFSSAFIPVFADYLSKGKDKEGHNMASTFLLLGIIVFSILSLILVIFAPFFLQLFNLGENFTPEQMGLMANIMRLLVIGQLLFIIGTFFTALLQSYNHFFIPGFAQALYNLGIIAGIVIFHSFFGIYSAPLGAILGATIFIAFQIPLARKIGFRFRPSTLLYRHEGVKKIFHLMWPRTIQVGIQQIGTIAIASIISFMADPGRMHLLFDYAKTLMFAPVSLIAFSISQAAFPVLAREKNELEEFKATFITSFNQMLYLILPVSALILVLRIPIVRLIYGADKFDWPATVLTGQTLAFLSISIFAQGLIVLFYRAFYALHNTFIPLITSAVSTIFLLVVGYVLVVNNHMGLPSIAIGFTLANIAQLILLFYFLDKKTRGFDKRSLMISLSKFFIATIMTGVALYIPIKLLDQLVFDTTRTINLIILTGISSLAGLIIYLFLTWLLKIREAQTYIHICLQIGNWREILGRSGEVIDANRTNP